MVRVGTGREGFARHESLSLSFSWFDLFNTFSGPCFFDLHWE